MNYFISMRRLLTFVQSIRRTKPPKLRKFHIIYLLDDPTSPQILIIQPVQGSSGKYAK